MSPLACNSKEPSCVFDGEISITEKLTWLDRQTDRNLGAAVEHFKNLIADQKAIKVGARSDSGPAS